jgi:hypothetical protein
MKFSRPLILSAAFFLLCSCTIFDTRQSAPPQVVQPKPLAMPVGKNWQIIEEPPKLSDERGRLPFQKEQSVQPEGTKPLSPSDNRNIETPR